MIRDLIKEINKNRFKEYLQGFTLGIKISFRSTFQWPLTILHLLAILLSIPLIILGIDWSYFLFFKNHIYLQFIFFPAVPIGGLVPLAFPPIIYLYAKKEKRPEFEPLAFALTQAAIVGTIMIAFYKAITARLEPEIFEDVIVDRSRDFAFGFLNRGVFHGWPSTHTTVAWAFAVILYYYKFEIMSNQKGEHQTLAKFKKYRKYGFVYAFYIGLGVSGNIHWLSDAVAGVIMGVIVGFSIVRTFNNYWNRAEIINVKNSDVYKVFFMIFLIIIFSINR